MLIIGQAVENNKQKKNNENCAEKNPKTNTDEQSEYINFIEKHKGVLNSHTQMLTLLALLFDVNCVCIL